MKDMTGMNAAPRALSDGELETVSGGGIFGRIVSWLGRVFGGPGDLRRPLDRP